MAFEPRPDSGGKKGQVKERPRSPAAGQSASKGMVRKRIQNNWETSRVYRGPKQDEGVERKLEHFQGGSRSNVVRMKMTSGVPRRGAWWEPSLGRGATKEKKGTKRILVVRKK